MDRKKISDTVKSLHVVEGAIADISVKMGMISTNSQEQSTSISTVNTSIHDIGSVTQKNAAMFEETSAACAKLADGAEVLQQLTRRFVISGSGTTLSAVA